MTPHSVIPERDLLATVVEMAQAYDWLVFHVLDTGLRHQDVVCPACAAVFKALAGDHARRIGPGFPDLVLAKPPFLYLIELKSERGKMRPDQQLWMEALEKCRHVGAGVVRPRDLDRLERLLRELGEGLMPGEIKVWEGS